MHDTAMEFGRLFFQTYAQGRSGLAIVDVGAQDVNGSLRSLAPAGCTYTGLDFVPGRGVDVIIQDPYALPLPDASADMVVCSSVFEHSEFFWLLFNEIQRILKPAGLLYLNVPSNGEFHRYPVDSWRSYPDSGVALQNWARRSGYRTTLLESFTGQQRSEGWNDFVAVFVKDEAHAGDFPRRIQHQYLASTNGYLLGQPGLREPRRWPEDQELRLGVRLMRAAKLGALGLFHRLPASWQQAVRARR